MSKAKIVFLTLLLAVSLIFFCFLSPRNKPFCPDCNVILVSIDTLRSDHLGCYGYQRAISPAIDEFCEDAVVYETSISQAPSTAPSHASIFTSLIPAAHGAFLKRKTEIKTTIPTMAEILAINGFQTASYNGGGQLDKSLGFNRGFEIYDSFSEANYENEKMSDKVTKGLSWIKEHKGKKFFLFLHSYDIHVPYAPDKADLESLHPGYKGPVPIPVSDKFLKTVNSKKVKLSEDDKNFIISAYDAEIKSVDRAMKVLLDDLKKEGLYDKTIIVITSDHGEEFGEHGYMAWHSHTLYDELLRVPLIIKYPNQNLSGKRVSTQTRSIDILPTILEVLNLKMKAGFQGRSLLDLTMGKDDGFDLYAISQKDRLGSLPTSARTQDWKLYKQALFDLAKDPLEKKDVAAENLEIKTKLRSVIDESKKLDEPGSKEKVEIEDESVEQLKTLGYF